MRIEELLEKRDIKSESIGFATAWLKQNYKSFDLPLKVMRSPTSGNYIMATSVKNPDWADSKRVYLKVIDGEIKPTNVRRWNEIVMARKATRSRKSEIQ